MCNLHINNTSISCNWIFLPLLPFPPQPKIVSQNNKSSVAGVITMHNGASYSSSASHSKLNASCTYEAGEDHLQS